MRKSKKTAPFSPEYLQFCRLLKEAREEKGITQVALAKRLRKYQSFIAKYESGERRLDVIEFIRIMKALDGDPCLIIQTLNFPR